MRFRSQSGLTLAEVMILVVIIMLLAAMAIPAFMKVRGTSIIRQVESGARVDSETIQRYREIKRKRAEDEWRPPSDTTRQTHTVASTTIPFQRISVEGQTFYLVPKQNARETDIGGNTFWLIPVTGN